MAHHALLRIRIALCLARAARARAQGAARTSSRCFRSPRATRASPNSSRSIRGIRCRCWSTAISCSTNRTRSSNTSTKPIPDAARRCFRATCRTRAIVRRLMLEVDNYFDKATDPLLDQAFWKKPEERDAQKIADGAQGVVEELAHVHAGDARRLSRGTAVGGRLRVLSAGRVPVPRAKMKLPDLDADGMLTPRAARVESDASRRCRTSTRRFRRTGRQPSRERCIRRASRDASDDDRVSEGQRIPGEFAFCVDRSRRARQAVRQPQSGLRVERPAAGNEIAGADLPRSRRAVARRRRE